MATLSDLLGLGETIEYGGRTYRSAPLDNVGVQAEYERYLVREALAGVRQMRGDLDPHEYEAAQAAVFRDRAAGVYGLGGRAWRESLKALRHQKHLLLLLLRANHPDVTPALVESMFREALDRVAQALRVGEEGEPAGPKPTTAPVISAG